ncbi:hypothetical protein [Novosphingobium lindaniclasticum]|uniref:Uncharacterized protein n=1 Tax=Novosphingobium lindaniclasticum LE124 TaxID=1096930 RepID=T0H0D0_9SPHN|nr:hypothetical protein [Novosphingobium lindaniclasticum]EQB09731.1 hypothetical protein L284_19215 [Novosphingobium lindaniclasticum LE124]
MMHSIFHIPPAATTTERDAGGSLDAWAELWREAPAEVRGDVIYLACLFPVLALIFLTLWIVAPA